MEQIARTSRGRSGSRSRIAFATGSDHPWRGRRRLDVGDLDRAIGLRIGGSARAPARASDGARPCRRGRACRRPASSDAARFAAGIARGPMRARQGPDVVESVPIGRQRDVDSRPADATSTSRRRRARAAAEAGRESAPLELVANAPAASSAHALSGRGPAGAPGRRGDRAGTGPGSAAAAAAAGTPRTTAARACRGGWPAGPRRTACRACRR